MASPQSDEFLCLPGSLGNRVLDSSCASMVSGPLVCAKVAGFACERAVPKCGLRRGKQRECQTRELPHAPELTQCRWPQCPFDSFAKCPFWLDRGWDSVEIEELPVSKCDNCHI